MSCELHSTVVELFWEKQLAATFLPVISGFGQVDRQCVSDGVQWAEGKAVRQWEAGAGKWK